MGVSPEDGGKEETGDCSPRLKNKVKKSICGVQVPRGRSEKSVQHMRKPVLLPSYVPVQLIMFEQRWQVALSASDGRSS